MIKIVNTESTLAVLGKLKDALVKKIVPPTKVSELDNTDTKLKTSTEIDTILEEVKTQAKTFTGEKLNDVVPFTAIVVDVLPTEDIKENTIYFVPNTLNGENNLYDEFLYIDGKWEKAGTTDVDLSGYSTSEEVNTKIQEAITDQLAGPIDEYSIAKDLGLVLDDYVKVQVACTADKLTATFEGTTEEGTLVTDWADGTVDMKNTHTYAAAGTYNVVTQNVNAIVLS